MTQKANPTLIGLFVLGAAALIIVGVLVFGSGKFFRETTTYVLFFEGDVANLRPGAPVTFRGVRIGSVTRVILNFDARDMSLRIPVFIEIDQNQIRMVNGDIPDEDRENFMIELVNLGLRAQLKMQSVLTGLLSVELDFHPSTPPRLLGEKASFDGQEYTELPTIPSEIERLQRTLRQLPVETMVAKAISSLDAVEEILQSDELKAALKAFSRTMAEVETLATLIHRELPGVIKAAHASMADIRGLADNANEKLLTAGAKLEAALDDARQSAQSADRLMDRLDNQVGPLAGGIQETLAAVRTSLKALDETLSAFRGIASKDASMGFKLYSTLDEMAQAARAIRIFAEYLERHPEALIRGKGDAQ
jgi:paraquat-inducible protein B